MTKTAQPTPGYRQTVCGIPFIAGKVLIGRDHPKKIFFDFFGGGVEEGETNVEALLREGGQEYGPDWVAHFDEPFFLGHGSREITFAKDGICYAGKDYWYYGIPLKCLPPRYLVSMHERFPIAHGVEFSHLTLASFEDAKCMVNWRFHVEPWNAFRVALIQEMLRKLLARGFIR